VGCDVVGGVAEGDVDCFVIVIVGSHGDDLMLVLWLLM